MLISHLTSLPLLLLLLAQTALTSPTPPPPTSFLRLRPRLVESTPWQLHDLRIFTAQPGTPGISYISFTFADSNAGLNLTTACTRYVPQGSPGGGGAVADGSVFSACANATVGWTFDGARIAVQRVYRDARYVFCYACVRACVLFSHDAKVVQEY